MKYTICPRCDHGAPHDVLLCYLLTGGAHEWIWLGKSGFPNLPPDATGDTFMCRHCHRRAEFPIRCIGPLPWLWNAYWEADS